MDALERVRATIRRHAMLAGGETVLVALSGGADSVALLHVLSRLAPAWRLTLRAAHVDHGLRPDSARDAAAAAAVAAQLGVPCDVLAARVGRVGSPEAAARAARYRALEACADRVGAHRIAVGHTADDQAETVLMRLLEGAGVRGLAGIPPVRGRIIRPLLEVRRPALVAALAAAGLRWVEDPTNHDPAFLRNRVRHDLLPRLAADYTPAVVPALGRVARAFREASEAIEQVAEAELARLATREGTALTLPLAPLRRLPPEIAATVLRLAVARVGGRAPLRAWAQRALRRALGLPAPRRPLRAGRVTVEASVDRLRVALTAPMRLLARPVPVPGEVALPEIDRVLRARILPGAGYTPPREPWRAAFDADRLPAGLRVRPRRDGDRLVAFGGRERRLKSLLIDAGVPRWDRCRVPLVEAGDAIVWVATVRRGAAAPVTASTARVLELALLPGARAPQDDPPSLSDS